MFREQCPRTEAGNPHCCISIVVTDPFHAIGCGQHQGPATATIQEPAADAAIPECCRYLKPGR